MAYALMYDSDQLAGATLFVVTLHRLFVVERLVAEQLAERPELIAVRG